MICHPTGKRVGCLHRIQSVHFRDLRRFGISATFRFAALEKTLHRPLRIGACKITVERQNPVGLGKISHPLHPVAQRHGRLASERLVLIKLRRSKFGRQFLAQTAARRAVVSPKQEADLCRLIHREGGDDRFEFPACGGLAGLEKFA